MTRLHQNSDKAQGATRGSGGRDTRLSSRKRGYDWTWEKLRAWHLASNPLCVMCLAAGYVNNGSHRPDRTIEPDPRKRSPHVDHVVPIEAAPDRRLDPDNLQTLCPTHHNSVKQQIERRGYSTAIGADGWPVDPQHPANR